MGWDQWLGIGASEGWQQRRLKQRPVSPLLLTTPTPLSLLTAAARPCAAAAAAAVVAAMEPMLQRVLGLQVGDALLIQQQARGLEAFAKLFGVRPDLAAPAVGRWVRPSSGGRAGCMAAPVLWREELVQGCHLLTMLLTLLLLLHSLFLSCVCAGCLMC
jgi:hypothetical protein